MADLADASHGANRRSKISAFNCEFDPLTKSEAVRTILTWMRESAVCRYVVTPNVHHLVLLQKPSSLRRSYRNASLILVDGRPVTWALKLLHEPVPEVVPGSDLVPALFDAATHDQPLSVFLLGAAPGVAERAKGVIHARWPYVRIVGAYGPPHSFENDEVETKHILDIVRQASPDLLVIGLGCPKQELWICRFAAQVDAKVAICAGATIDFIAGHRQRAPLWVQQIGFEWLFRAIQEPRRMGKRYLRDVLTFPAMIVRELWKRRQASRGSEPITTTDGSGSHFAEPQMLFHGLGDSGLNPHIVVSEEADPPLQAEDSGGTPDQDSRQRPGCIQLAAVTGSDRQTVRRVRERLFQAGSWDNKGGEHKTRVLLTGHEGYLGCVLAPFLLDAGYDVVGLDSRLFVDCTYTGETVKLPSIDKDIRDVVPSDLDGFDAVLHLAGLSDDPLGNFNSELMHEINLKATARLAEYAKAAGVSRFLFSSSCSVYGAAGGKWQDEAGPLTPVTPHGVAKMRAERNISRLADDDFSPTFLRSGTTYGLAPRIRFDLVVNNLVAWAVTSGGVLLKSDGTPWRSVVHVQDVARAFVAVLRAPRGLVHNEAFNVGRSEENYRIREIAEIVANVVSSCRIDFAEGAGPDVRSYRVNCSKIARVLPDFRPEWTVRRGVVELYEAYQRVGLTLEEFEGDRFSRVKYLQSLLASSRLERDLRWRDNPCETLLTAAG